MTTIKSLIKKYEDQLLITKELELDAYEEFCNAGCNHKDHQYQKIREAVNSSNVVLDYLREVLFLNYFDDIEQDPYVSHLLTAPPGKCIEHEVCKKITNRGSEYNYWMF